MLSAYDKLEEARYFLDLMDEVQQFKPLTSRSQEDEFRYLLSAFVNSLYSIFEFLKHDPDAKQIANTGIKDWVNEKIKKLRADQQIKYLLDLRRSITHFQQKSIPSKKGLGPHRLNVILVAGRKENPSMFYFEEYPNKSVISICREALLKVESFIKEIKKSV